MDIEESRGVERTWGFMVHYVSELPMIGFLALGAKVPLGGWYYSVFAWLVGPAWQDTAGKMSHLATEETFLFICRILSIMINLSFFLSFFLFFFFKPG